MEVKKFKKPALQIKLAPTAGVCDLSPKYYMECKKKQT